MSESLKIAFTALGTAMVFVIGQLILKFLIEPIQEQKKLIGEIAGSIIFYSNVGPGLEQHYFERIKEADLSEDAHKHIVISRYEELIKSRWSLSDEASKTLRRQAAELLGKTHAIPFYDVWTRFGWVPKLENVIAASSELIGMSNSTNREDSFDSRIKEIVRLLKIQTIAKQRGIDLTKK